MGNRYTSLVMRGDDRDAVVAELGALERNAFVAGPIDGWIVVFDQESEQDPERAITLGKRLTARLAAPALLVRNDDDDALDCRLFQAGRELQAFTSGRRCSVDAALLCGTLGSPAPPEDIARILRRRTPVAVEAHQDLAEALGLPSISAGMGFYYVRRGFAVQAAPGVELVATGSARVETVPRKVSSVEEWQAAARRQMDMLIERAPPGRQASLRRHLAAAEAYYRQHPELQDREDGSGAPPFRIVDDDE